MSSLVSSLAWPATVLVIILLLRRPLSDLVPFMKSLKYKDLELQFGERLEAVEQAQLPTPTSEGSSIGIDRLIRLAEVSPRAAVLEAWVAVELAALKAARAATKGEFEKQTMSYQSIRVNWTPMFGQPERGCKL